MASIIKRKGSYLIRVSCGSDPSGKQIIVNTTWKPEPGMTPRQEKKALERFAFDFEDKVKAGTGQNRGDKLKLSAYAELWLENYVEKTLKPATLAQYRTLLHEHILPEIGSFKLSQIHPMQLNALYDRLLKKENKNISGSTLSRSTVQRCRSVLQSIFTTAIRWGDFTGQNPASASSVPRIPGKPDRNYEDNDPPCFNAEQTRIFLDLLDKPMICPRKAHTRVDDTGKLYTVPEYVQTVNIDMQFKLFFYMCIFCGCRRGELLALTWQDINFQKKEIKITKETTLVNGKPVTDTPKTRRSNRIVSVSDIIIDLLLAWQAEEKNIMIQVGTQWKGYRENDFNRNYLFIQSKNPGLQMYPSTPYLKFKRIIRHYNATVTNEEDKLPEIELHGLRHSHATLQLAAGTDVEVVSERLGHAQTSTTMNIYAHALRSAEQQSAEDFEAYIMEDYG